MSPPAPRSVTALVLAGGRATRMGGVDKGLALFRGQPLAWHAVQRLRTQHGDLIGPIVFNANRNAPAYEALGGAVWPDSLAGQPGPLAGVLTGLERLQTDYLLTVPCDSPLFPLDLAQRLAQGLGEGLKRADIAIAATRSSQGGLDPQPVFALMHRRVLPGLRAFLAQGGRQVQAWSAQHNGVSVLFEHAHDFANTNTQMELQDLQDLQPTTPAP
jgi:molybdopterin-guanine dinucleotide biosynthesis protein A